MGPDATSAGSSPATSETISVATRAGEASGVLGSFDPDEGSAPAEAPVPGAPRPLKIGQRVRHPMFGEGKILNKTGAGENVKVTVLFNNGTRKDILTRYANFEIL